MNMKSNKKTQEDIWDYIQSNPYRGGLVRLVAGIILAYIIVCGLALAAYTGLTLLAK